MFDLRFLVSGSIVIDNMVDKSIKDVEVVKVFKDAFSKDLPSLPQMESLSFIDVM